MFGGDSVKQKTSERHESGQNCLIVFSLKDRKVEVGFRLLYIRSQDEKKVLIHFLNAKS